MGNLRERKRRIFQPLKREYVGAVCIFSEWIKIQTLVSL